MVSNFIDTTATLGKSWDATLPASLLLLVSVGRTEATPVVLLSKVASETRPSNDCTVVASALTWSRSSDISELEEWSVDVGRAIGDDGTVAALLLVIDTLTELSLLACSNRRRSSRDMSRGVTTPSSKVNPHLCVLVRYGVRNVSDRQTSLFRLRSTQWRR